MKQLLFVITLSAVALSVPVTAAAAAMRDLGPAPATDRVAVAIMLPYRHEAELDKLIEAQADPSSSIYHRFLTPREFGEYFGPTESDYSGVIRSFERAGFTITHAYGNRTIVDATAPVPVAERYFSTRIDRVAQPHHGIRHVNVTPVVLPAAVRGLIAGVVGINDTVTMRTFYALGKRRTRAGAGAPFFGPDGGYFPRVFVDAYDMPSLSGYTGLGRTAAIVIDADFLTSDVANYIAASGGTFNTYPIVQTVDGGPTPGLGSDSVEATLDVETTLSLAPAAHVYVYEMPDLSDKSTIDAYETLVADNVAETANSSFGGCESEHVTAAKLEDRIAAQGEALGITFHAATGDSGYLGYGCISTSVSQPASEPHFVAVGGTTLAIDPRTGKELYEYGWGDDSGASGGGISVVFPTPDYQLRVTGASRGGRNLPDVAFDASPGTGASFYYDGQFDGPIGGTSLSSPIFGAMLLQINQMNGSRSGFVNPGIYAAFAKDGYKHGGTWYFRDETVGYNGYWEAGPGYDHVTGIGSVNGTAVGRTLKKSAR